MISLPKLVSEHMHYTVTSPDGSLRSSSRHLEDAINSFARKFLGFQSSVCWTRTPGATTGAKEIRLCTGGSPRSPEDAVSPSETLWLFDPRERYEQLMGQLECNLPDESALKDHIQEIAVLIPMISGLSLAETVARVNGVLPSNMRCRVSA